MSPLAILWLRLRLLWFLWGRQEGALVVLLRRGRFLLSLGGLCSLLKKLLPSHRLGAGVRLRYRIRQPALTGLPACGRVSV